MKAAEQFAGAPLVAVTISLAALSLGFLIGSNRLEADDHQPPQPWSLDQSAVSAQLKAFFAAKEAQARALAKAEGKELPRESAAFFAAAAKGDTGTVTNLLDTMRKQYPSFGGADQSLSEPAWEPILEIGGALEVFADAGDRYPIAFGQDVIKSIPRGSVFFGGTDWGRFVISALSTSQINGDPFFTITPKFFARTRAELINSNSNLGYLRSMYGQRLKIPTVEDVKRCVQDYISTLRDRQARGEKLSPDEQVTLEGDTVQVYRTESAMNLAAAITKLIFDDNPDREFYVEESYVIAWMYPYLEPHGLILKLNRAPLTQIDPTVIAKDREFWDGLTKRLLADAEYLHNNWTRRRYSKLRSAVGGVYVYRRMTDEAEYAFKQAITLDPTCPEGIFRLTQLYTEQNRVDDAIATIKSLQQFDPTNQKIQDAITQLQSVKQAGLGNTHWLMGPSYFRQGDSITITDVRASSPEFKVGDTVKVTGRYTLSSKPRALLCLNVTTTGKGGGCWEPNDLEQELQVAQGSGEFVLSAAIKEEGHLHLTFYDAYSGNPFGGFYFGTNPQMQKIANWHLKDCYAKE
jgi:tetratricopeptide (TPR) repeat protein